MLPQHRKKRGIPMNLDNRRLIEIQKEKSIYRSLLNGAESISDCITYQSRLEVLEDEEKQILKRCDVKI